MSKNTKRHCMVVHAYYPIGEPRVQREAEALIDSDYEVDVICLRQPGEPSRAVVYGVNIYRLPMHRHKGVGVFVQLLEYMAFFCMAFGKLTTLHFRQRYGAIQVHNPPDFLVFVALIPRLMGAKVILDLHDLMPEFYASRFKSGIDSLPARLICWQERLACRFAHHVITVTEPWRQTLILRGLSPDKCSVVMNTADTRLFHQAGVRTHSSQNGHFQLFYHGNLTKRYGVDLVLKAIALQRQNMPGLSLTIHGRGEYLDDLQRQAQESDLGDSVFFSSEYMPMEDLPALIAKADLGVVPYRRDVFTDGILPTKLMEYAALGIPAIVARTPAITAYFDETMVEYFTPENVEELAHGIQTLYDNQTRLGELASNIQKFNQRYNWVAQKAGYVELVAGLAERKPRNINPPSGVSS
jgi:glycosyltransferase involved in cell wall biosynthesis